MLTYLAHSSLADEHTMIITEASKETGCSYLSELGYHLEKERYIRRINICLSEKLEYQRRKKDENSHLSGQL